MFKTISKWSLTKFESYLNLFVLPYITLYHKELAGAKATALGMLLASETLLWHVFMHFYTLHVLMYTNPRCI